MLCLPARLAEVLEAGHLATEVGSGNGGADGAEGVLEEGIDLDAFVELGGAYLDVGGVDGAVVRLGGGEGDAPGPDGVLVLVGVDAGVDDVIEEIVHDAGEDLGGDHAVQGADEDGLLGVESLGGGAYVVGVGDDPGDDLNLSDLLGPLSPRVEFVVVVAAAAELLAAVGEERADGVLLVEDDVDVAGALAARRRLDGRASVTCLLARPLHAAGAEVAEAGEESRLRDVPGDTADEDFAGVDGAGAGGIAWREGVLPDAGGSLEHVLGVDAGGGGSVAAGVSVEEVGVGEEGEEGGGIDAVGEELGGGGVGLAGHGVDPFLLGLQLAALVADAGCECESGGSGGCVGGEDGRSGERRRR